jgi:hypothetical protein
MHSTSVILRATKTAELVRGDGGEGHLADGNAGSVESGGKPRRPHAPAPGADGEEVEVVLPLGGGAIGGLSGRRDATPGGVRSAEEPREGGEGREAEEAAAEMKWTPRGESAG